MSLRLSAAASFQYFSVLDLRRHCHRDGLTDSERHRKSTQRLDADRESLRKTNPIDGLANRRQQIRRNAARPILNIDTPTDASDYALERLIAVTHNRHGSPLYDFDMR